VTAKRLGVLDLYCGLGGLSLGLEMTGSFDVLGGVDIYEPALETFRRAHPNAAQGLHRPTDLGETTVEELRTLLPASPDVVVGGPPCQGWSAAGRRLQSFKEDDRNRQVFEFMRIVKGFMPPAFLMENVSGIKTTGQKHKNQLLDLLCAEYERIGYSVRWKVLDASLFRVPQKRKRMILVGTLADRPPFLFPEPPCGVTPDLFRSPESVRTTMDALGDLPEPSLDEPQSYNGPAGTTLQTFLRMGSEELHNHLGTKHSPEMVEKLEAQAIGSRLYDWNHSWYRLDPDAPSPTIKMNNRAPAVHFKAPRLISPRECARLQTIPDRIRVAGNKTQQLTQIGNAVPPVLAAHIGTALARQVFGYDPPTPWDLGTSPLT
jgi:DNA (cytosine-5)-methyltransferase 1